MEYIHGDEICGLKWYTTFKKNLNNINYYVLVYKNIDDLNES
jgi:hypothetical protein